MSIDAAYDAWAPTYDSQTNRTRDLDAAVACRLTPAGPLGLIIEAGCGTGKNTVHYATVAASVLALDFSPGMLALARQRVTDAHVRFEQADLLADWPVACAAADRVVFHLVLEHVADLTKVLLQAACALRPGGQLLISELHPARQYRGSQAHYLDSQGQPVPVTAHIHHLSDYLAAARSAGMQLLDVDEHWHGDDDHHGLPRLLSLRLQR